MPAKKDNRYFISCTQFNCPYCQTGAVKFEITETKTFDWSNNERVTCVWVECQEPKCKKESLHLSKFRVDAYGDGSMKLPWINEEGQETTSMQGSRWPEDRIDELFFFHQPNSSFVIDGRISNKIREALDQANTSHKMSLPIGSSAALRKAIFELLSFFEIPKIKEATPDPKTEPKRYTYQERIDLLQKKLAADMPAVDAELINDIKKIYSLVSQPLHERLPDEEEFQEFTSEQFLFLMETVHALLIQIFITPAENDERKNKITALARKVKGLI